MNRSEAHIRYAELSFRIQELAKELSYLYACVEAGEFFPGITDEIHTLESELRELREEFGEMHWSRSGLS